MGHGKGCLKKFFQRTEQNPERQKKTYFSTRRLNKETSVLQPAHTIRLKPDPECEQVPDEISIVWFGLTDTGRVRDHNEDFFSCLDMKDATVFAVADGMGGHDAGEVASKLAVDAVCREIRDGRKKDPRTLLEQAMQRANAEVLSDATKKGSNMGTTLTMALVLGDLAYIANVGDSRTYWIENGSIRRITTDHSLVAKMVSLGKLTEQEARSHPKSNVLYRNIGSEAPIKVDTFESRLRRGGSLLLCSDGLWGELTDQEIHAVFLAEKDARNACTRLVQLANDHGGKDNITAIVVKVT